MESHTPVVPETTYGVSGFTGYETREYGPGIGLEDDQHRLVALV